MNTRGRTSSKQKRSSGSLLDVSISPPWHSAHLQDNESSMRSTLASQDVARPGLAHSHPAPPPQQHNIPAAMSPPIPPSAPPATPTQRRMSISSLINPVDAPHTHRSTVFTPINSSVQRQSTHLPVWTPAETPHDRPWRMPTTSELYAHNGGHTVLSGFNINMHEVHSPQFERHGKLHFADAESLGIDKEDGRVYHLGHDASQTNRLQVRMTDTAQVGSFSGSFIADKPGHMVPQAKKWIRENEEKNEKVRLPLDRKFSWADFPQPLRTAQCVQAIRDCRRFLSEGALLALQRTSFGDDLAPIACCRPYCKSFSGMPEDSYYLSLEWDEYLFTYCLRCLEDLWNGKFTDNLPIGDAGILESHVRRDSGIHMGTAQLDGPPYSPITPPRGKYGNPLSDIDIPPPPPPPPSTNDNFISRHADPEDFASDATPPHLEEGLDSFSSPSSTISNGEWRHPPTRFQHLASFVTPSPSLSATDKAALALWKEASRDQMQWERLLRKTKYTQDYYDGRAEEDKGLGMETFKVGEEWDLDVDVDELGKVTGLRKKDCQGRDLSEVLREVEVARKRQQSLKV